MPSMNESDHRLLQDLDRRVKFLAQRIVGTPSQPSTQSTTALQLAVDALQISVDILNAMIEPGIASGFMDWGPSAKGNAWASQDSGFDRGGDRVFAGGQLFVRTKFDAPTILLGRAEVKTDNQNVGRIDFVPYTTAQAPIYPNGSDDAGGAIGLNLHVPSNGSAPADGFTHFGMQVINGNESNTTKPPRTVLQITGENGGEIWGYQYNSTGGQTTVSRKLFP